jgi:hypothetical protein
MSLFLFVFDCLYASSTRAFVCPSTIERKQAQAYGTASRDVLITSSG